MTAIDVVDSDIQVAVVLFLILQYANKIFAKGGRSIVSLNIVAVFILIGGLADGLMYYHTLTPQTLTSLNKLFVSLTPCILTTCLLVSDTCWIYFSYYFFRYEKANEKTLFFMSVPFFICLGITLSSPVTQLMYRYGFNADGSFIYEFGPLYYFVASTEACYLLGTAILVFRNRKYIKYKYVLTVLFMIVATLVGTVIQLTTEIWLLLFPMSMLSLIITYLVFQDNLVKTDYTTGTIKKAAFDSYVRQTLKLEDNGYGIAYITLKNYTKIRKDYGKYVQNMYINDFGKILVDLADERAEIIYSQSGDYIIYVNSKDEYVIEEIIEKLARLTSEYNNSIKDNSRQKIEFLFAIEMFKKEYKNNFGLISAAARKIEIMQQEEVQPC